jgi:putative adenylate-forming enzyme
MENRLFPGGQSAPARVEGASFGSALWTLARVGWQRHVQERSCGWSRARLEQHQRERLDALRRFVVQQSPFYRRFHQGLQDRPLADLPMLTKATLMEHFDDLVTDRELRLADLERYLHAPDAPPTFRDRYVVLATSGTTGRRGVFVFDDREWIEAVASITRPIAWSGAAPSPLRPPRSALIASATPWHYSARIGQTLSTRLLPTLRLDAGAPTGELVTRLNDWRPQALAVYPSVLNALAGEQLAGRLRIALAHVATSAEMLTDETRRRVQRAWGIRVFDTYGATEYAPIAAECAFGNRHLVEDGAIVEIVDERGRAVPSGETGERILLTVLGRRTQPLIRYEISDRVRERAGDCPCGRPFRLIDRIEGRIEDVLQFPRHGGGARVAVHPNRFHDVLETVPATGWQVVQHERALSVHLTGDIDPRVRDDLRLQLERMLQSCGAEVPAIEVIQADRLRRGPTGKAPLIVAHTTRDDRHAN